MDTTNICLSCFVGRAPKTVKLFINQLTCLGFDEAEQRQPEQELWSVYTMKIDLLHVTVLYCVYVFCIHHSLRLQFTPSLTEEDVKEDAILPLKFVRFQTVHSITVSKCGWPEVCLYLPQHHNLCMFAIILNNIPDLCEGQPRRGGHHSDKPHWIVWNSKRYHQGQPGECYTDTDLLTAFYSSGNLLNNQSN